MEVLELEDQEFWTELTRLTQSGTLQLRWSWELMREMRCLVEVSILDKESVTTTNCIGVRGRYYRRRVFLSFAGALGSC